MNGLLPVIQKEFREIMRDPYTMAFYFILPLVLFIMFGTGLNLDVKDVSIAVVDLDKSQESRAYVDAFINTDRFSLKYWLARPEEADQLLDQGKVRAVLLIPSDFSTAIAAGSTAQVQTIVDGTYPVRARIIQGYVERINESFTTNLILNLITQLGLSGPDPSEPAVNGKFTVRYNPSLKTVNFLVPGLIATILMAFTPLLSALAIVREKERGSVHQIFISPVRPIAFVIGKMIPYVVISYAEFILVLLIARYGFNVPLAGNVWLLLLLAIPFVLSTVSIGLLISVFVRSQLVAMLAVVLTTMMPAFSFSGFIFPVFNMPEALQAYASAFPTKYFVEIVRGFFLKGIGPQVWMKHVGTMMIITVVLVVISSLGFKKKEA